MNGMAYNARLLARDGLLLACGALALAILAMMGRWLFSEGGGGNAKQKVARPHLLRCPECGDETTFSAKHVGKLCPNCKKGAYEAAREAAVEAGDGAGSKARLVIVVLVSAVVIQGFLFLSIHRLRALREAAEATDTQKLYCRCPYCKRKLSYPITRVGSGTVCRQCKTAFTLPGHGQGGLSENS